MEKVLETHHTPCALKEVELGSREVNLSIYTMTINVTGSDKCPHQIQRPSTQ